MSKHRLIYGIMSIFFLLVSQLFLAGCGTGIEDKQLEDLLTYTAQDNTYLSAEMVVNNPLMVNASPIMQLGQKYKISNVSMLSLMMTTIIIDSRYSSDLQGNRISNSYKIKEIAKDITDQDLKDAVLKYSRAIYDDADGKNKAAQNKIDAPIKWENANRKAAFDILSDAGLTKGLYETGPGSDLTKASRELDDILAKKGRRSET